MRRHLWLPLVALLVGCGAEPALVTSPRLAATERVPIAYRSVAVLEISLPTYAASDELAVATPEGGLAPSSDVLWADAPERAVTLAFTRALGEVTGARIAPVPWPFLCTPDATVDIRVEELLADGKGMLRFAGQYFVAPDAEGRREVARRFALDVPYNPANGLSAVAVARSQAVQQLAVNVARGGLR